MKPDVATIDKDASLMEAVVQIDSAGAKRLIVAFGEQPVGQLTVEQLNTLKKQKKSLASTSVEDVMQKNLVGCYEETDVRDAADLMRAQHVDEVPVVDRYGSLVGRVTMADLPVEFAKPRKSR